MVNKRVIIMDQRFKYYFYFIILNEFIILSLEFYIRDKGFKQ